MGFADEPSTGFSNQVVQLRGRQFAPSVEVEGVAILDESVHEDGNYTLVVPSKEAIKLIADDVSLLGYR